MSPCVLATPTTANWLGGRSATRSGPSTPAGPTSSVTAGPQRLEDLAQHALVGFDDTMAKHRIAAWLHRVAPNATVAARSNSVLGLVYSAKAGIGVAPLPIALGDAEPDLVRVIGPVAELSRIWRVLTTPELRRTPRVTRVLRLHRRARSRRLGPSSQVDGSAPYGVAAVNLVGAYGTLHFLLWIPASDAAVPAGPNGQLPAA